MNEFYFHLLKASHTQNVQEANEAIWGEEKPTVDSVEYILFQN